MKKIKIAHISSVHAHDDIRIFHKECKTLSKKYEVHLLNKDFNGTIDGVIFHKVPFLKKKILRVFSSWFFALKETSFKGFKVIHFHDPELLFATPFWKLTGKKVIYDVHENYVKQISTRKTIPTIIRFLIKICIIITEFFFSLFTDLIIVVIDNLNARLDILNKSITIGNYPIVKYKFIDKPRKKQFVYIGKLSEDRGILKVAKILNIKNIHFIIAGNFSSENFKKQILSYPNVKYLGVIGRAKIEEIVSESIGGFCTLFPTPNHLNSSTNKFFEYLAFGTPVVASNFKKWTEFIPKKNNFVFYVNPLSDNEIERAVEFIVECNSSKINKLGYEGHKYVKLKFNWDIQGEKLIGAYKLLIN